MRYPAQDSVKPAGYPLIIRALSTQRAAAVARFQDKRDLLAKSLFSLKVKEYRTGKAQKRNDYPCCHLHSMISRNKTPGSIPRQTSTKR
ncbi:TPA: hypothetical protein I9786_002197 [Serratia marcescens]|nr:hypothetical protein [Serratia marcescens]